MKLLTESQLRRVEYKVPSCAFADFEARELLCDSAQFTEEEFGGFDDFNKWNV